LSTDITPRQELLLAGCASVPLAGYLKALGTFRIVAEQSDETAAGHWTDGRYVLTSRLDRHGLERLLLEQYRPTPIVAPWNGGSGFYPKDNQTGIDAVTDSRTERLEDYRRVLDICRHALGRFAFEERPKDQDKLAFLTHLRARLPESALPWLDAAVVLTSDAPGYPPLLGTGGNDGRLDFTNNFMQRLVELIDYGSGGPQPRSAEWLRGALFDEAIPGLTGGAIGQFAPGNAGGPNASTGFGGGALVNPWDFVLMLEGAVLFAAATTRRLDASSRGAMSFPFTVRAVGAGSGSAARGDESDARGEMWLPLWSRPVRLEELRALLAEGRATVRRRTARDGLDFVRAVSGLGIDRGIAAFERYGFLMRSGRAFLASPLGRIRVRPDPQISLVDQLEADGYLDRLRRFSRSNEAPGSVRRLVALLEGALFELARHGGRYRLQEVLMTLGELQRVVGTSPAARDAVPPVPALSHHWVRQADDGSHEFRLAAALAGLHAQNLPMRCHVAPVSPGEGSRHWEPESRLAVWGAGDLVSNLGRALERRLLEAERQDQDRKPFGGQPPVDLAAVGAFLRAETDDRRIARLLGGLAFVRSPESLPDRRAAAPPVPAAFAALKPLFVADSLLRYLEIIGSEGRLPLPAAVAANLLAGRVQDAVNIAWQRLRVAGVALPRYPVAPPAASGLSGRRLAAALMVPLRTGDLARLSHQITIPPKKETEDQTLTARVG
jgi:CRISPR-associated protein Csx17